MTAILRYPPAPDWQLDLADREAEWDALDGLAVPGVEMPLRPRPGYLMAFLGMAAIFVTGLVLWLVIP